MEAGPSSLFSPNEIEFLGEEEEVSIIPNFRHESINMLMGPIGPFVPNARINVPLWMAVYLKRRRMCRIIPPDWLTEDVLTRLVEEERNDITKFLDLPFHYFEVGIMLLQESMDDIPDFSVLRTLLEDLHKVRMMKLQGVLTHFNRELTQIPGIASVELQAARTVMVEAKNAFDMVSRPAEEVAAGEVPVDEGGFDNDG
eukprot:GILI01028749.1.p1 GENE.GILI01028749.1~~GILI01028749.1.p1  ORF type:complete len:199 (+),score=40.53 GILI01028749.1:54-650(+)